MRGHDSRRDGLIPLDKKWLPIKNKAQKSDKRDVSAKTIMVRRDEETS